MDTKGKNYDESTLKFKKQRQNGDSGSGSGGSGSAAQGCQVP